MKVSQVISKLRALQEEHGDVLVTNDEDGILEYFDFDDGAEDQDPAIVIQFS